MEGVFPTKERERLLFLAAPWYNSLVGYYTFDFKALFLAPLGQPEKMADYPIRALHSWYNSLVGYYTFASKPFFSPAAPGTEKHGGLSHSRFALMV